MAKFLAFKDNRGKEVYVNAALVRAVRSEGRVGHGSISMINTQSALLRQPVSLSET
jgi:hypothetical protein